VLCNYNAEVPSKKWMRNEVDKNVKKHKVMNASRNNSVFTSVADLMGNTVSNDFRIGSIPGLELKMLP